MNDLNNFDKKVSGKFYTFFDWMAKIILLNAYFVIFSILGLIVLGIGPSIYATYKLMSMWKNDYSPKIFTVFFNEFRKNFIKSNLIFYLYSLLGVILYFDLYYFLNINRSTMNTFGLILSIILIVMTIISFLLIYPIKINTNLSWKNAFTFSFMIQLGYPIRLLKFTMWLILVGLLSYIIPHLSPFFIFGLIVFIAETSYKKISNQIINKSKAEV